MKEAIGESSMTLITITLVAAAVALITAIVSFLLSNQRNRTLCENSGGQYTGSKCMYNGQECTKQGQDYVCGEG